MLQGSQQVAQPGSNINPGESFAWQDKTLDRDLKSLRAAGLERPKQYQVRVCAKNTTHVILYE